MDNGDEETMDNIEKFEMPSEYPHEGKRIEEAKVTYIKGIRKGGMGAVYLGEQDPVADPVAYVIEKHPNQYDKEELEKEYVESPEIFGEKYEARLKARKVILKHILWEAVSKKDTKNMAARFNVEGKILKQLSHDYGIKCVPKTIYIPDPKRIEAREDLPIIMEYAGDLDLKRFSEQEGKLEEKIRVAELGFLFYRDLL